MRYFWWFFYLCLAGALAWTGDKIFTIRNTEARVDVLEKENIVRRSEIKKVELDNVAQKVHNEYVKESLDRIQDKLKIDR